CVSVRSTGGGACGGWRGWAGRKARRNGSPQMRSSRRWARRLDRARPLRRQHLEHVAVRIPEIKTASATTVIDLHVVERAGSAAISNALGADAAEDAVKLRFIDLEGVVVTLELRIIV